MLPHLVANLGLEHGESPYSVPQNGHVRLCFGDYELYDTLKAGLLRMTYQRFSFRMKLSNFILLGKILFSTFSVNNFGSKPKDTPSFCHHRALGSTSC